jgi:hypothetical protein
LWEASATERRAFIATLSSNWKCILCILCEMLEANLGHLWKTLFDVGFTPQQSWWKMPLCGFQEGRPSSSFGVNPLKQKCRLGLPG